jgi:IclR family transcriptional regulator, pca regulon regulatory protein
MQAVSRVALLLDAFTVERPELTLSECSAAAGLSKSSAHRFLASLEEVQFVERVESRWRLGPRVVWLATVRLGHLDLRHEAAPRLRLLGRRFHAATAFSIPSGSDMIYVERSEGPGPFGVNARLGALAPIWGGASGRAILMRLSESERAARLDAHGWRALDEAVRREILDDIDRGIETGYCFERSSRFFPGIGGVAVPIVDLHGLPVAAISVILPPSELSDDFAEEIGAALLGVARELESHQAPAKPAVG